MYHPPPNFLLMLPLAEPINVLFPFLLPTLFQVIPSVTSVPLISPWFYSFIPPTAPQLHISVCQSQSASSTSLWFKKRWGKRRWKTAKEKVIGRKMKWLSGPSRKSMACSSSQAIFLQLFLLTEPSCQWMKFEILASVKMNAPDLTWK